jgi:hypothetical protein
VFEVNNKLKTLAQSALRTDIHTTNPLSRDSQWHRLHTECHEFKTCNEEQKKRPLPPPPTLLCVAVNVGPQDPIISLRRAEAAASRNKAVGTVPPFKGRLHFPSHCPLRKGYGKRSPGKPRNRRGLTLRKFAKRRVFVCTTFNRRVLLSVSGHVIRKYRDEVLLQELCKRNLEI